MTHSPPITDLEPITWYNIKNELKDMISVTSGIYKNILIFITKYKLNNEKLNSDMEKIKATQEKNIQYMSTIPPAIEKYISVFYYLYIYNDVITSEIQEAIKYTPSEIQKAITYIPYKLQGAIKNIPPKVQNYIIDNIEPDIAEYIEGFYIFFPKIVTAILQNIISLLNTNVKQPKILRESISSYKRLLEYINKTLSTLVLLYYSFILRVFFLLQIIY